MRAKFLFIFMALIFVGWFGIAAAAPNPGIYRKAPVTVIDPGDIFIPNLPQGTPMPEPTDAPESEDPPTPIGYNMDANDYLVFFYNEIYKLKVNDGEEKEYSQPYWFRLRFVAQEGVSPEELAVGLKVLEPGKFQLQIADFEPADFTLTLTSEDMNGTPQGEPIDLQPGDKAVFQADSLTALFFEGEAAVTASTAPEETVSVVNKTVVYIFSQKAGSDLRLRAVDMMDPDEIPQNPPPPNNPTPKNPPAGNPPAGNNPSAGNDPDPTGDTDIPTGGGGAGLRGGGRLLSCSLNAVGGQAMDLGWILLCLMIPAASILRRKVM